MSRAATGSPGASPGGSAADGAGLRLDKWLWFARFARSRSLAARLCAAGAVTVGGMPTGKASQMVRIGDVLTIPQGRLLHTVRILALGERRGPASEACRLYAAEAPARPLAAESAAWQSLFDDEIADPLGG